MISIVTDSYVGASSIRVFNCVDKFRKDFYVKLDLTTEAQLVETLTSYFMQIRLDLLTDLICLIFLIIAVVFTNMNWITIGLFAMIINNSVMLCGFFGEIADVYKSAETELIAIERLDEYIKLEKEPIWNTVKKALPLNSHSIQFENISLRYRENDPPVLHNINFYIESKERVAIIGRTGAGKFSPAKNKNNNRNKI